MKTAMQTFSFVLSNGAMAHLRSRKGAPGLVEVAARAGVSPATVSRFFNSPDVVKPETKARISEAAADLGYIRDRMAGTLHNRFSGTIGLIVPTIDNAIFAELIEAFAERLRDHDRTMLIASHGYDLSMELAIVRSLLERRIDGVVMIGFDHEVIPLEMLEQRNVPVILAWNYRDTSELPCIGTDNEAAGAQVTRYLIERNHRDIAFLFPETERNDRARDRLAGALRVVRSTGIEPDPKRLHVAPYDIGKAKQIAIEILAVDPPSAVVCGNDIIAQGVVFACQASGFRIPEDISIIGIGDFRGSAHMEPGLTTLRLPARRIGQQTAETIVDMSLNGQPTAPLRQQITPTLMERGSTKYI